MNIMGTVSNNFAKYFRKYRDKEAKKRDEQVNNNSQAISQEQLDSFLSVMQMGVYMDCDTTHIDFQPILSSKRNRISKYREMYLYPEISDVIDQTVNEAITSDDFGDIVRLNIKSKSKKVLKTVEKRIQQQFTYLLENVYNFNKNASHLFKKFLLEGELFIELIMDDSKSNLIGFKVLPAFTMIPIYDVNSNITKYVQVISDIAFNNINSVVNIEYLKQNNAIAREFEPEQIVYINYGSYGMNKMDVRGYLETAIRTYNQLKNLEDAIVVYRLVRAPERKIWNIYTGRMPKGKAEEYIKNLMIRYRKRNIYDASTGAINSALNIQSASEDYWFSKDETGQGTSVDSIGGAMNLGEIEDINYFLKKLYRCLKYPTSRWLEPTTVFGGNKVGEITREEINYSLFVESLLDRFKYVLLEPLKIMLRMIKIDDEYISDNVLHICWTKSNMFKETMDVEVMQNRFNMLGTASSYIWSPNNEDQGIFSKEFVIRNYFKMSDDDYNENQKLLKIEKDAAKEQQEEMNNQDQSANLNDGNDGNDGSGDNSDQSGQDKDNTEFDDNALNTNPEQDVGFNENDFK